MYSPCQQEHPCHVQQYSFDISLKIDASMQLQTLWEFSPQKHALFLHPKQPLLAVHESTDFVAAVTRNNEVVLHNTKTGRSTILLKSQHGIDCLAFTHEYLLVVQHTVHEILVFSLRNEKLKKRLTGHRSQVTSMAYCRNTALFASLSHDQLLVFSEQTLNREKLLRCSTSSFADCAFSLSGNTLATAFTDGSIFLWETEDYSHRESGLAYRGLKVALNSGSEIAAYNGQRLFLADLSKEVVVYQQIDKFWHGQLRQVNFLEGYVAVNTDSHFYLADIQLEHQFIVKSIREFGETDEFAVAEYQSALVLVTNKLRTITIAKVAKDLGELVKTRERNPLTNQGLVCAGGFSNTEGCFVACDVPSGNTYQQVTQQVEKISAINYEPLSTTFSLEKLQDFIRKHHCLPDKHRPLAYRYLLKLPISPQQFRALEQKGRHECAALLDAKYPLENRQLAEAMKDVLSLLAHYHPVFAEADFIPTVIFPFVCLFGNDYFLCFEILYRLFTIPLSFLFKEFPVANSAYLQNVRQIFAKEDPELLSHFSNKGLSFTKASWSLLTTLFSACLGREHFLAIIDSLFVRINQPQYVIFLLLGFLVYNRARILSINSHEGLVAFLDQEQTIHLGKFLGVVDRIAAKYRSSVRYPFEVVGLEERGYQSLPKVPPDALKMYENKRRMLTEELSKRHQQERNRDNMLKEMQELAIAAKRQAERQAIERQAYHLHCQNESAQTLTFKPRGDLDRIARIEDLIDQLSLAIQNEQNTKDMLKNYLPSVSNLQVQSNEELDFLQLKLAKLLADIKPQQGTHWLKSQPIALKKDSISNFNNFKAAVNTRLAGQLWDLQNNTQANKMQRWQNNMLSSINH